MHARVSDGASICATGTLSCSKRAAGRFLGDRTFFEAVLERLAMSSSSLQIADMLG